MKGKLNPAYVHGMYGTPTYRTWCKMIARCNYVKGHNYKWYGGRGIKICKSWMKFENFYKDMGIRPEGKWLDRIDSNKNYSKNNCRWATIKEQQNNKRSNRRFTYQGLTLTIPEWAKKLGIKPATICTRFYRDNLPIEKMLASTSFKTGNTL